MSVIVIIIVLSLVVLAFATVARKRENSGIPSYDPNARWAHLMTQAGEQATGQKSIFCKAWSLSGLKTQFACLRTPVVAIMAISAWETGWGKSSAAMTHNNLSGISTHDVPRVYATIGEWFNAMSNLLQQPRYAVAMQQTEPSAFVRELGRAGYNSSATWLAGVLCIVAELNVPEVV